MIKQEALKKIIAGEKKSIRIEYKTYNINFDDDIVILVPVTTGSIVYSSIEADNYTYTHGGNIYREAVHAAWEIESALRQKLIESSDLQVT